MTPDNYFTGIIVDNTDGATIDFNTEIRTALAEGTLPAELDDIFTLEFYTTDDGETRAIIRWA